MHQAGEGPRGCAAAAQTQHESVLALTVEMLTKVRSGKIIEARHMAKKIQALTKGDETVSYKAAAHVPPIEANQPSLNG